MYKQYALGLMLLAGAAVAAGAQTSADATVQAEITANLQIAVSGITNFGTIGNDASTTHVVDAHAPAAGTSTAQFAVTGTPNAAFIVTYGNATLVNASDPAATVSFIPRLAYNRVNDQAALAYSDAFSGSSQYLSGTGEAYLWLGGSLQQAANQQPGTYSGTFTLTLTYQ